MIRRPWAALIAAFGALTVAATALLAHDLFLKPDDYFLDPGEAVRVRVLNGNFENSEAALAFDRVADFTVVGPAGAGTPADHGWKVVGDTSMFALRFPDAGTYLVGVSTRPRILELAAEDFNAYLESDGIPDVLAARRRDGELDEPARERYAKHVKALVQVGSSRTVGFDRVLGYPAEVVPLENPYTMGPGDALPVRAVVDGQAVAHHLVVAGGRTPSGGRHPVQQVRTDARGEAVIRLTEGTWYVKFIHMVPAPTDSTDYVSKWATLTFAVRRPAWR